MVSLAHLSFQRKIVLSLRWPFRICFSYFCSTAWPVSAGEHAAVSADRGQHMAWSIICPAAWQAASSALCDRHPPVRSYLVPGASVAPSTAWHLPRQLDSATAASMSGPYRKTKRAEQ